ncbi:hypothetical protein HKX48_002081 [Thoreauomyces humboldtii]|nr:hypothetical protein HKX48_002081 [Thoreauomyces humboldtii]
MALPAAPARLQALAALRNAAFPLSAPKTSAATTIVSRRAALLSHYPPNVCVTALAAQDPKLTKLRLIDTWKANRMEREEALTARGKPPRVSVATGKAKKPEAEAGKKKKRK